MRKNQVSKVYVSDFETLTASSKDYKLRGNKTGVFLFFSRELHNTEDVMGYSIEEFFKWCEDGNSKTIYFHNLSFDGNFIAKYLMKQKKLKFLNELHNQDELQKSKVKFPPRSWKFFHNDNKIYNIQIKYATNKKTWTINIKCSLTLLSAGVNALAKDFGMVKQTWGDMSSEEFYALGGFNMDPETKALFEEYIKNDVEVVRLALLAFDKTIKELPYSTYYFKNKLTNKLEPRVLNIHKILTAGSIVKKMSINYLRQKKVSKNKDYEWDEIFKGYTISYDSYKLANNWKVGGFTQFSPNFLSKHETSGDDLISVKNGTGIDINSSYPYQATKILPYGEMLTEPPPPSKKYVVMEYLHIKVKSATIKAKATNFVSLKNWKKRQMLSGNRYEQNIENFECYYLKEEWELLQHSYDFDVESITTYYTKGADYFKEFIELLYKLKENAVRDGNPAIALGYKILLNTFYGKNTARAEYEDAFYISADFYNQLKESNVKELFVGKNRHEITTFRNKHYADEDEDPDEYIDDDDDELPELSGYKIIKTRNLDKKYKSLTNVLIGSTIASYGRIQLQQAVKDLGWNTFIYGDTDSIYTTLSIKSVDKKLRMDKYELGAWGIDAEFTGVRIIGAKRYIFKLTDNPVNKGKDLKFGYCGGKPDPNDKDNFMRHFEPGSQILGAILRRVEDEYGIILIPGPLHPKQGTL